MSVLLSLFAKLFIDSDKKSKIIKTISFGTKEYNLIQRQMLNLLIKPILSFIIYLTLLDMYVSKLLGYSSMRKKWQALRFLINIHYT